MAYTFEDQLNKLAVLLGDSDTSSENAWTLATRKKEINAGELAFALESKLLKEYASGTVASMELSVPSDWLGTFVLTVGDKVITNDREVSIKDWERYYNVGTDYPYYYFWQFSGTRKIKFLGAAGSVNGKTYQLFYFKRPITELDANADVSLFPEEYRKASVYYAAAELLDQIGKTELSDRYRQIYYEYVARAMSEGEKQYVNKEYPRPDFGDDIDASTAIDRQGHSSI